MPSTALTQPTFLPMSRQEMDALGWDALDILFITGDAYVDHPAFGVALLGRWLVAHGFRVGICAQPRWDDTSDIECMGRPTLFAGITAGALDSMLAHYTAFRKKRHDDSYTPGGKAGARPNRASIVYANLARRAFPGLPLILGGIEASLRRISHYDFWSDSLRRSLLLDAKAHMLVYGMGERAIVDIAKHCAAGHDLEYIDGTAWMQKSEDVRYDREYIDLPSHEAMLEDASLLMDVTLTLEKHVHAGVQGVQAAQTAENPQHSKGQNTQHHKQRHLRPTPHLRQNHQHRELLIAPPALPLNQEEMDQLYALPFQRAAHPSYTASIAAEEMLRTSITSHRGCGGGCAFCSLALHQGRHISSRSAASLHTEAVGMTKKKGFTGSISDVGGPTANMWQGRCTSPKPCTRHSCCHPKVCPFFATPQMNHVHVLRSIKNLPGIKHVRVASGIRADIAMHEPKAIHAYTEEFTGGQLKIAPEHSAPEVLHLMRKPPLHVFETFLSAFQKHCEKVGREQYVVPYLMSAYPGCSDDDMRHLAAWLRERHWKPQQVQCFIPTPGTVATAMFYTGLDTQKEPIFVARTDAQRLQQHRILMPSVGRPPQKNMRKPSHGHAEKGPQARHNTATGKMDKSAGKSPEKRAKPQASRRPRKSSR